MQSNITQVIEDYMNPESTHLSHVPNWTIPRGPHYLQKIETCASTVIPRIEYHGTISEGAL